MLRLGESVGKPGTPYRSCLARYLAELSDYQFAEKIEMTVVSQLQAIGEWSLLSTGKIAYATKTGLSPTFSVTFTTLRFYQAQELTRVVGEAGEDCA